MSKSQIQTCDFGWKTGWFIMYPIVGAIALLFSAEMFSSKHYITASLSLLASLNLLGGWIALKWINQPDKELILPIIDQIPEGDGPMLDAGCGAGRSTIALSKAIKDRRIVALDRFDAEYIRDGGRRLLETNLKATGIRDRVDIVDGDLMQMRFEDSKFALAASVHVIDHMGKHQRTALKELCRVLKPGGRLLLVLFVPNYFSFALFNVLSLLALTSKKKWEFYFKKEGLERIDKRDINGAVFYLLQKV